MQNSCVKVLFVSASTCMSRWHVADMLLTLSAKFNASDHFTTALASTQHFLGSFFCLMTWRTATMCMRYSLLFPQEYMGMLRWDASGSLILKIWGSSLGVRMSTTGTYGMGGLWDSCPFSHSASFNLSGDLREVLILAYCQSLVPSRSFLKEDLGRTCRNPAIWMVAWRFAECKFVWSQKKLTRANSARTTDWMVWYGKFWPLAKCTTWCE